MVAILLDIINWLGIVSTILVLTTAVLTLIAYFRGFLPVLIRLGHGLWNRKIAIFARSDALVNLCNLLHDSKLFKDTNFLKISGVNDLGVAENASIFLVYWPDWEKDLEKILDKKKDSTALVVFAPQDKGKISETMITLLEKHRNVVVNNFRGRLLNDIVVSMITTGYEKK